MARRVHVYGDIEGDWRPGSKWDTEMHAEDGGEEVRKINSVTDLIVLFITNIVSPVDFMDFHTHGSPGKIFMGAEKLSLDNLNRLENQALEKGFNKNAEVIFTGCNVAEKYKGEYFLVKFGQIMLKNGGGTVKGNTTVGFRDPIFTGDVFHPAGDWVTAQITTGGSVTLNGHRHLIPKNIAERLQYLEKKVMTSQLLKEDPIAHKTSQDAVNWAKNQFKIMERDPSYYNMFATCWHLEQVEIQINLSAKYTMDYPIDW